MDIKRNKGLLYLQIKEILKDRILNGEYSLNTNIPSEPQLEAEFKVSKITVRNAIKELVQEGYLKKESGKGTMVISNVSGSKLSKGKRFTEVLVEEGHYMNKKVLSIKKVELPTDSHLYPIFGNNCIKVERVYYLDDEPYIYFTHFVLLHLNDEELKDVQINSLYRYLEQSNIRLESFRDEFTVTMVSSYIGEILKLKEGTAVLKRIRRSRDEKGSIVEYSEGYYNTEKHNYIVNYNDFTT
ncbi:GntR family transcriptional regulator [Gracilibacillus kekensis]|uniref:Transcriptional regulator, GntR family n=1 Tax=Gracilibacillus kekensis TaxID=1027249 RepID=A0A1M7QSQ8_9BACI|nr:GntR family transcriptional regulator [Gracilibacillus kekensis]SHN34711.1 transcriptional regulator, GntR family [Gracilibacillus kekensis]